MYKIKLSPYHKIFYNEWKLGSQSSKYNIVFDQTLSSTVSIDTLRQALCKFVADYLLFDSHVEEIEGGLYWVQNSSINELEVFDNNSFQVMYNYVTQSFILNSKPLYRFALFKENNSNYRFIIVLHHILIDANSFDEFIRQISQYYNNNHYCYPISTQEQIKILSETVEQYNSSLQKHEQQNKEFWRTTLADMEPVDLLFLKPSQPCIDNDSTDNNLINSLNPITEYQEVLFSFDANILPKLQKIRDTYRISPFWLGQMVFATLINRYSSQRKFIIGYPTLVNRSAILLHASSINTNGFYCHIDCDTTLSDLINQTRVFISSLKDERENYCYPIYNILQESIPLLSTYFVQSNFKNTRLSLNNVIVTCINHDFNIDIPGEFVFEQDYNNVCNYRVRYEAAKVDKIILKNFINHYQALFLSILKDLEKNLLSKQIFRYEILSKEECQKIVYDWNNTYREYPQDKTIHQLFEEQVEKTPDRVAIVYEGKQLTYQELNQKANQLARYLLSKHVINPDDLIVLYLDRSEYMLIAILAVLKCGAAYVPIDINYPSDRIRHILYDTQAKILLINCAIAKKIDKIVKQPESKYSINCNIIIVDNLEFQEQLMYQSKFNVTTQTSNNNLAYVIYTSGTTGNPKGVMVEHRSVVNTIYYLSSIYRFDSIVKITAFTSYIFDVSVSEFFVALINGGELHILSEIVKTDVQKISNYLLNNKINYTYLPPVLLAILPRTKYNDLIGIMYAGEPCNKETGNYWSMRYELYNLYGPTETSIYATGKQILNGEVNLIGKPISNVQAYILDVNLNHLPVGAIGELYIGGAGLTRGYLNQPKLTEDKFIVNIFQTVEEQQINKNVKLYKTGDLVRYLPDGNIEYIGRNDCQVKIRGYRIELGEIETTLCGHSDIKHAIVLALDKPDILNDNSNNDNFNEVIKSDNINIDTNNIVSSTASSLHVLQNSLGILPIQEWFFAQNFANLTHWNQSFLIKTPQLNKNILIKSIIKLMDLHDNFRFRYTRNLTTAKLIYTPYYLTGGNSENYAASNSISKLNYTQTPLWFHELDITQIPYKEGTQEFSKQLEQILTDWQSGFDIESGYVSSFGYIYGYQDGSTRIYCALHHLIVDVVSWHIILHDLQKIYINLCNAIDHNNNLSSQINNLDLLDRNKYTSYQQWITIVRSYATTHMHEKDYWVSLLSEYAQFDKQLTLLITDTNTIDKESNVNSSVKIGLDHDYTNRLINKAMLAFNSEINAILLTPFAIALKELLIKNTVSISNISNNVYITMEGHGRENIYPNADTTHTIGWFTTMFPVKLVVTDDLIDTLKSIKKTLCDIPNNGIGYGALFGYIKNLPRISFNYLGQINSSENDMFWSISSESSGKNIDNKNNNCNVIDVNGRIMDGQLIFTMTSQLNQDRLNQFADIFRAKLTDLIDLANQYSDLFVSLQAESNQYKSKYLAAYYVSDTPLNQVEIMNYLSECLPQYSIPQKFIWLDKIPLTLSGKLNTKALPNPDTVNSTKYVAPESEKENLICQAFAKALYKKIVGTHDDFFICGGNSISAITLTMSLQRHFNVNVHDIFTFRTPKNLAHHLTFSNNSIKDRLLAIAHTHEQQNKFERFNQEVVNNKLKQYINSVKIFCPDISHKTIKNVLLTGATGYLGCNILHQLLIYTDYTVYLLVRAVSEQAAIERIKNKYKFYFTDELDGKNILGCRIFVLCANIEKSDFGLARNKYMHLVQNIDSVIHTAALVKQVGDYNVFYAANVLTTINLLEFIKLTKLKDFHYISTLSILKHNNEFYNQYGNFYTEESLPDDLELIDNNLYLKTKMEAERQVIKYRDYGINTNIYRIGTLVFMLKNLSVQDNVETVIFTHWIKYIFQSKRILSGSKINISPVDLTAQAVVKLFDRECSTNNIYHVFNPHSFDLVHYLQSHTTLSFKILTVGEFIEYIISDLEIGTNKDVILNFLLVYGWLGTEGMYQFAQRVHLQNRTQRILELLDFRWSAVTNEQFGKCLNLILKRSPY